LLTHTFSLGDVKEAYEVFGKHAEGVIKVGIKP
jgi:threonine dehydrogenase-like Zn-dependent dehydrogenase